MTLESTKRDLQFHFNTLVEYSNEEGIDDVIDGTDDDENIDYTNRNDIPQTASISSTLDSIKGTLQQYYQGGIEDSHNQNENGNSENDKNDRNSSDSSFIRTNLAHYNKKSTQTPFTSDLSLRSIVESKTHVIKLQHLFAYLMTKTVDDNLHDDSEDESDIETTDKQHNLSLIALKACHVYLQSCLLPGSWSCGWIDVVTMRYIENLVRKWSLFCCEYRMFLENLDTSSRKRGNRNDDCVMTKRSRVNDYEHGKICGGADNNCDDNNQKKLSDEEEYIFQVLQLGIEVSQSMAHVLLRSRISSFWNWNEECREAFLDSLMLSLSTCTALRSTFSLGLTVGENNRRRKMKSMLASCKLSLDGITRSLEDSIGSSVEHEVVSMGRCNDDDDGLIITFQSPSQYMYGDHENIDDFASSSLSRTTTITLLRNIYPLLTYQSNVPNGVKGKQEVFDKCRELLSNIVKKLSSKLKTSAGTNELSINAKNMQQTSGSKRDTDRNRMLTPLSGKRGNRKRSTLSPKSTNRKRKPQNKDDLNAFLNVPPSLKKNVTPKRASHRKSLSRQQHSIRTGMKSTQRRMKQNEVTEKCMKDILNMFLAIMQKLATGKMMERVEVRKRMSLLISSLLNSLKGMYRVSFVSFVIRLCRSKISSHRVFGVELLSSFLLEGWLWEINVNRTNDSLDKFTCDNDSLSQDWQRSQSVDSEFPQNEFIHFAVEEPNKNAKHISNEILSALHNRITDRAPAVRTRAAVAIGSAFKAFQKSVGELDGNQKTIVETTNFIIPHLISSLRQRACCDDKATVRKATIQALVDILEFDTLNYCDGSNCKLTQEDVSVLCHLCQDKSLAVRKVAADAIVSLLLNIQGKSTNDLKCQANMLENAWVHSVMPMIHDNEQACVLKVVESFESLIMLPLVEASQIESIIGDVNHSFGLTSCWRILALVNSDSLASGESKGSKNALKITTLKSFESKDLRVKKRQSESILMLFHRIVITIQKGNEDASKMEFDAIWCMLEILGALDSNTNPAGVIDLSTVLNNSGFNTDLLLTSCKKFLGKVSPMSEDEVDPRWSSLVSTKSCLTAISSFAPYMTKDEIKGLAVDLKAATKTFSFVLDLIGPSTLALISLASAFCIDSTQWNVVETCTDWIKEIYYGCEAYLNIYISSEASPVHVDDVKLARVIYTVGEMSMVGYKPDDDNSKQLVTLKSKSNSDGTANPILGLHIPPSNRLMRLIQSLLPHTLPTTSDTPGREVSSVIRAHAFVTFGKICLRDESLTKEHLNVFAKELLHNGPNSNDAVRSNALLILGDLCITYTNHVDKFIPLMASCLQTNPECSEKSKSSIVQQHALILFSNLILQGYIKWKGLLFHRFAAATVANDSSVSTLAKALLCGPLLSNEKTLLLNNFVGSIFVLNGCYSHCTHKAKRLSMADDLTPDKEFILRVENFEKRMEIYRFLLDNVEDEEKIAITAKIAKEVLSSATETSGLIPQAASTHGGVGDGHDTHLYGAYCVLSDSFSILTDPRLMVGKSRGIDTTECEDLNSSVASFTSIGPTAAQLSSVKYRLLSKISRKHLIETMIPILCNLKVVLEKGRSPLLKDLMQYLVFIFRQFKQEVNEVLESDETLLQEIKYDTRKFEKSQNEEEELIGA